MKKKIINKIIKENHILVICSLISVNLHIILLMPTNYRQIQPSLRYPSLAVSLKVKTGSAEDANAGFIGTKPQLFPANRYIPGLYVPEEITDHPAYFKKDIHLDLSNEDENGYALIKLYINASGWIDKIDFIESTLSEDNQKKLIDLLWSSELEPAIFKGYPVDSMLVGKFSDEFN